MRFHTPMMEANDSVSDLVKTNKIEVIDIRDETDLKGLATIDIKRNTSGDLMNKLYMMTPLQDTFHATQRITKANTAVGSPLLLEWIESGVSA